MGKTLKLKRVIIFGGNLDQINPEICFEINENDFVVCADAGYKFAIKNNIIPDLIVGDFDSSEYPQNINTEIVKLPTHKDDTDLHYAVNLALERGFNDFLLTGVTGGRLDQTFATVATLNYLSEMNVNCKVSDLDSDMMIVSSNMVFKKPKLESYFSVFSITEKARGVTIKGAEYILNNAELTNIFPIGVSNEFKIDNIEVFVKEGKLLVIIVKKH